MKIPSEKLKPFTTEIAPECSKLISSLKNAGDFTIFAKGLDNITEWCSVFGKTELGRWVDVLNDCDAVLESALALDEDETMSVDKNESQEAQLISVLRFTSLLFENTFGRSIYSSMDRLTKLLYSSKIWIVVSTLRLLMVVSKCSRFITQHLNSDVRLELYNKLMDILEVWAGKLRLTPFAGFYATDFSYSHGFSIQLFPEMDEFIVDTNKSFTVSSNELKKYIADSTAELKDSEKQFAFTKLRFLYSIKNQNERSYQVIARLISSFTIFYSRCLMADDSRLIGLSNEQFIERCCALLHFEAPPKYQTLADILKTEALKTLASIFFLEKTKKIQFIVYTLGLKTYHGFCPSLLRNCIERLKAGKLEANGDLSFSFVTSPFSLVYHVVGFEYGGDSLNRSSMVPQYISYVTRSVRIIYILTGIDQFNSNDGTDTIIKRFSHEIEQCKTQISEQSTPGTSQQRSALMKSVLNFIKRAMIDANLAVQMRRIMEVEFPQSLIFIIQHSQYFGSSLLHCTISLITNFIYQETAQLTMLQTIGLTDAIMNLIFDEKFPISRDLFCSLPNICSTLCLNERGHNEFKLYNDQKPLEKIFKIIFSNKFLLSMRKRRTEILENAHMLGTSFDELIRHHPILRKDVMGTISNILDELLQYSTSEDKCIPWSMGKAVVEDDSVEHVLFGDYMAIMGVMLETILSNRSVQDNIQTLNELNIPFRLVKLLSEAKKPNPVLLNSSVLPNLANILCFIMQQTKGDEAFSCSFELSTYLTDKECQQEKLYQLSLLSSLVNTTNILMKSVIHAQGSYDIRPLLLHHFATDVPSRDFIDTLFNTYKLMSSKLLANDKIFNAARQTTSQILEDTTKVRDLLRIDDDQTLYEQRMDVDSQATTVPSSSIFRADNIQPPSSMFSVTQPISFTINIARAARTATPHSSGSDLHTFYGSGPTNSNSVESSSNTAGTTSEVSPTSFSTITERSVNSVAYRCHRQAGELIICIGKIFCNSSVLKVRQRLAISLQLSQETLKKDFRNVCTLIFGGVQRLLQLSEIDSSISMIYITTPLNFLKKLLIDDINNIQQLLPDFYLSGCYKTFFFLATDCFKASVNKEEFTTDIHLWLNIAQKFSSPNLTTPRNGSQPQQQQRITVEGFELKNFLATAQKDTFSAVCSMLKELMKHCETFSDSKPSTYSEKDIGGNKSEQAAFKLLEKLKFMKGLFKDMMKLLELIKGKSEAPAEIPVVEIDPNKLNMDILYVLSEKRLGPSSENDIIDRANFLTTPFILAIAAILTFTTEYAGQPIKCWTPSEFLWEWDEYAETLCYIESTYYVTANVSFPIKGYRNKQHQVSYYQWIPFILLMQTIICHLPIYLWRLSNIMHGINIPFMVKQAKYANENDANEIAEHLLFFFFEEKKVEEKKSFGKIAIMYIKKASITIIYILVKIIFLMVNICQLIFIGYFLGMKNTPLWGITVVKLFVTYGTSWEHTGLFPRITYCDFKIRMPNDQFANYTIQCLLSANYLNEKIFLFLYYWFGLLSIVTLINIYYWCWVLLLPSVNYVKRQIYLYKLLVNDKNISKEPATSEKSKGTSYKDKSRNEKKTDESTSTIEIVKEVNLEEEVYQDQKLYESFTNNLGLDGILTLMLIHSNAGPRMVSQITGYMFKKYIEEKKK